MVMFARAVSGQALKDLGRYVAHDLANDFRDMAVRDSRSRRGTGRLFEIAINHSLQVLLSRHALRLRSPTGVILAIQ